MVNLAINFLKGGDNIMWKAIIVVTGLLMFSEEVQSSKITDEEVVCSSTGAIIGAAVGNFIGKYVILGLLLNQSGGDNEDRGIIGNLLAKAVRGQTKSWEADFCENYVGKIGTVIGATVGGRIGYATTDVIYPSFSKVLSYFFKNGENKPNNGDYVITIATILSGGYLGYQYINWVRS